MGAAAKLTSDGDEHFQTRILLAQIERSPEVS
jgi:hypothetical protein